MTPKQKTERQEPKLRAKTGPQLGRRVVCWTGRLGDSGRKERLPRHNLQPVRCYQLRGSSDDVRGPRLKYSDEKAFKRGPKLVNADLSRRNQVSHRKFKIPEAESNEDS